MSKTYQDYCREAVARDPKTYGSRFNKDGTKKPLPNMSSLCGKKIPKDVPKIELGKFKKNGWKPESPKKEKPKIEVTGTEVWIKGRKQNLTTLEIPKGVNHKEYNRIWMHNNRVRAKIKMLKEKYGVTTI